MSWEVEGRDWRQGTHNGTLAGREGLELIPGVSRGLWRRTLSADLPFRRVVASLNPEPWPLGSGVRVSVRVPGRPWRSLGVYGEAEDLPRSEEGPEVAQDLWTLDEATDRAEVRLEVEAGPLGGSPRVRRLVLEVWDGPPTPGPPREAAWGRILEVPRRSQRTEHPDISARVCSPTSLAMVLEHHGHRLETAEVAAAVLDRGADIYGNWSFNVSFAASLGLRATVRRLAGLPEVEEEVLAGRPVIISHAYEAGELPQAPLERTDGHLLVVVGFTQAGDVVVHDPAADPAQGEQVRRTYPRAAVTRAWQERGAGIAYLICPA